MPGPCPHALGSARVPARRFVTRAELWTVLEAARAKLAHGDHVSLRALATEVGLSPYHLARLFRRVYGQSPGRYGRGARLDRAWPEFASHGREEAAQAAGYAEPRSYSRAFRRRHGAAPAEVRKNGRLPSLPSHST